jgi:hypothetical protein
MAFVSLTTEQVNADSPLDTTLMLQVKDNFDDLDGARVTNGDSHDHIGGDGAPIGAAGLSFTTASQASTTVGTQSNLTITMNRYFHIDTMSSKIAGGGGYERLAISLPNSSAAINAINLNNLAAGASFSAVSMTWDYHSS